MSKIKGYGCTKESLLELPMRKEIYNCIENNQGIHFREICKKLNRKMGVVQYHIKALESNGVIKSEDVGRYRCFFTFREYDPSKAKIDAISRDRLTSFMHRPTASRILTALYTTQEVSHKELAETSGVSPQAITFHMKMLGDEHLIVSKKRGRTKVYGLQDDCRNIMQSILPKNIAHA